MHLFSNLPFIDFVMFAALVVVVVVVVKWFKSNFFLPMDIPQGKLFFRIWAIFL